MILNLKALVIVLSICLSVDSARILGVFITPSISHQVVLRKITAELAKRGHEVVVITSDPLETKNENITEIDTHDVSYKYWREVFVTKMTGAYEVINFWTFLYDALIEVFEIQMQVPAAQELIKNKEQKFDLIIYDAVSRVGVGFSHIFKAPVIAVSTLQMLIEQSAIMGAPRHPILYPNIGDVFRSDSYLDKIVAIYKHFVMTTVEPRIMNAKGNEVLKRVFGEDCPDIDELTENVDMLFTNANPFFEGNRPLPPSVINLGGIHLEPPKELPKNLQEYLDQSKNGVIYVSFGTNVAPSLFPPPIKNTILKVLSRLPYDVLLKWDVPMQNASSNFKIAKFWPQNDLLRHPNVKLFITQGGLQSTDEAIVSGVPLVALPVLADQYHNGKMYEKYGIGIRILLDSLTEDNFQAAIEKILSDDIYRQNIRRLAQLISDQPQKPLERAIWWAEYVIRNGGAKHLRVAGAMGSWAEFLMLDVLLVLLSGVSCVLLVIYMCIKGFVRLLSRENKSKVE